jgi:RNA polymerase sigma-70 factor (ECF subfamily)
MPSRHTPLAEAEAFAELYKLTHLVVFRYIFSLNGGPQQEVEDLTAETFIRAWKARQRFDGGEKAALSWLLRIARNLVIDAHRRTKVRGVEANLDDTLLIAPDASPEEQVALREQFNALWVSISTLQPQHRDMIVLRYVLGWPVKRIAAHLDMLENTTSVNLRRILQRMQRDWPDNYS